MHMPVSVSVETLQLLFRTTMSDTCHDIHIIVRVHRNVRTHVHTHCTFSQGIL